MTIQIDPATAQLAETAAQKLKEQLVALLLSEEKQATSCGCGARGCGTAAVVDIEYPSAAGYRSDTIGLWRQWSVKMRDATHGLYSYSMQLSDFIPTAKLFPLFRNAFQGINVAVEVPKLRVLRGDINLSIEFSHRRGFSNAGQIVRVPKGGHLWLRPQGDLADSIWLNAELAVDANADRQAGNTITQVSCILDPFIMHIESPEAGPRYSGSEQGASNLLTFFIAQDEHDTHGKRVPIARLVDFDQTSGDHIFALAEGVEEYFHGEI